VPWDADRLDAVIDESAATGYGLTLGIHSRIDETVRHILARLKVGNSYVKPEHDRRRRRRAAVRRRSALRHRPQSRRPRYLHRSATERTVSTDTAAPAATRRSCHCSKIRL
jgi:RHH-type proline utilization regulon transcriptional repressor/proline dehydrogenase/delta 1-pyrroline-5-carboxylate dehydrogenase